MKDIEIILLLQVYLNDFYIPISFIYGILQLNRLSKIKTIL